MADENKTRPNGISVDSYIDALDNPRRRDDAKAVLELYREVTGHTPVMWGSGVIGFGSHHYRYDTGREGDVPLACFAPRKPHLTFYLHSRFEGGDALYARLGKYKKSGGCVHVNKLDDLDLSVFREIVARSYVHMQENGLDLA